MSLWLNCILFAAYSVVSSSSKKQIYSSNKLNVHIVPHTHDDPGWLKTADQYFYGSNTTIYKAGVQYILDTVTEELEKDENKHFVYVEMSFFQRWYFEQTDIKRASVKKLVHSGQLSFANGGWVMHDEAGAHYVSMVDQTTLGHRFLLEEFGYTPRVGWQIDPFGHSASQPNFFGSDFGFDSLFFGRIDYEDRQLRKDSKTLEFVWNSLKSDPQKGLFTGVFSDGNYGYPSGFCFDVCCDDQPVMDDARLEDFNAADVVKRFTDAILQEQSYAEGQHIMLKMGSDFHYTAAHHWYKNLDKLITLVNERDERFHLFYSDPVQYTLARADEGLTWSVKTDDFFPYADCEHCYWGGYFSSRPTLKLFERIASSYLQVLKQITTGSFSNTRKQADAAEALFGLTAAVGLVNHHDAITGTSKQHVADDYTKILDKAFTAAERVVNSQLTELAFPQQDQFVLASCRNAYNESSCTVTEAAAVGDDIYVVMYNALGRMASQHVSVFLSLDLDEASVSVLSLDVNGKTHPIASELYPTASKNSLPAVAPLTLSFYAENIRAVSFSRFVIQVVASSLESPYKARCLSPAAPRSVSDVSPRTLSISSDKVSVSFDTSTGLMTEIARVDCDASVQVTNDLLYYISYGSTGIKGNKYSEKDLRDPHVQNLQPAKSAVGSKSSQRSGAYIFRPADDPEHAGAKRIHLGDEPVLLSTLQGTDVSEVRQVFSDWASQVVRVFRGSEVVEVEWTVGPIPIDDLLGREVISRFESNLNTQNLVYTDANGREFQERLLNFRPTWDLRGGSGESEPVGGNYYPTTAAAYIKDSSRDTQLTVLTDRAQAAASLQNGQLEFMVHRRLVADDSRGVGEPLNETVGGMSPYPTWERSGDGIIVSGKHYVLVSNTNDALRETRELMDKIYQPLKPSYALKKQDSDVSTMAIKSVAPLAFDLPANVQLMTFQTWAQNILLVRLAHQFALDEDASLSAPVTIDVGALLASFNPESMEEMSLSVNQNKATMLSNKIQWRTSAAASRVEEWQASVVHDSDSGLVTTLSPMEIKTFLVSLKA